MIVNNKNYSFLPWLREGIANNITADDLNTGVIERATIKVDFDIQGTKDNGPPTNQPFSKDIELFGPGDIVGFDSKAIIKIEPGNWITNFEGNYLAHIEFYDEDFPWRYTPARADSVKHRLRPWIMLAVLKEDEFKDGKNIKDKPLPFITADKAEDIFPPKDELWAWCHVHFNSDIAPEITTMVSTDMNTILPKIKSIIEQNPDFAYSRIICPRKLEEKTAYHAFLIPVFETGRLAGLGLDPNLSPYATFSAWEPYTSGTKQEEYNFPYYYRWYFHTGTIGDFEYLVRLLKPMPMDKRVGRRDMDVEHPGSNISGISDPELGGILKLGGALQIPFDTLKEEDKAEVLKYENWAKPYPHKFQEDLSAFINLADDYANKPADQAHADSPISGNIETDPDNPDDPLIIPPIYGKWHALVKRLLKEEAETYVPNKENWIHNLNLDPRFRVAAGFGTEVIQKFQEEYMDAAWEQVGEIIEANNKMRMAELAKLVSASWHARYLLPLMSKDPEKALLFTQPVQNRILTEGITASHFINTSVITSALTSLPFRKLMRPRGRIRKLLSFSERIKPENLLTRVNNRNVSAAPPKQTPQGIVTLKDAVDAYLKDKVPSFLVRLLRLMPWFRYIILGLIIILGVLIFLFRFLTIFLFISIPVEGILILLFSLFWRWADAIIKADKLLPENQTPESVETLPKSPDFRITQPGEDFSPRTGTYDSAEAVRFKTALKESYALIQASGISAPEIPLPAININALNNTIIQAINPELTMTRLFKSRIKIPHHLLVLIGEKFKEAMAYPRLDIPMYKPLTDISSELFLPNINYVEKNSISLLETNQRFIEAYMVGLNHEFGRELLWREYPTDQRGSYFRQFWDPSSYLDDSDLDAEALKEKLKDIPPLHLWSRYSKLGDHDHREEGGDKENEVVLVIRGELLKKYPTAVIYAHKAVWQKKEDDSIDNTKERRLVELEASELEKPPKTKVKTPLYEAKVSPDIYFFGFDLTVLEARGDTGENPGDEPGWFFVIKERPGEPRFGLDISREGDINVWNDLSWNDVLPDTSAGTCIPAELSLPALVEPVGTELQEKVEQYKEDKEIVWNSQISSAEIAYVLFQAPVMVAVHACEMLPAE